MNLSAFFIAISSLLALSSYVVYISDIVKGKAKPHRTTRFVLVLITALATASLLFEKSTVAIWMPAVFTFGSLIIFGLSLKYGMGGSSKIDLLCLAVALIGIIFWKLTNNPLYGLYASIGADLVGEIPMLIKTYKFPETESMLFYLLDVFAAGFSLLAVQHWILSEYAYSAYIFVIDSFVVFLIVRPKLFIVK